LFATRDVKGMAYPDFYSGRAFAVSDHGVAHVYCRDTAAVVEAKEALSSLAGVAEVLNKEEQAARGLAHRRSGELMLIAAPGTWFAYPWFEEKSEAPDFAGHVDIHNKPGYDPCELFFGWPPGTVSLNTVKIRGTHGSNRARMEIAWSSSLTFKEPLETQLDLAGAVRTWMNS
jgi:hypothetical protein